MSQDRKATALKWQESHPRQWWALENMEDGEFRDSLIDAMETGRMTPRRELHLWHLATKLEREARGEVVLAPAQGTRDTYDVVVTKAEWCHNKFAARVFQVSFISPRGWRGRWETTNDRHVQVVSGRTSKEMQIVASVKWSCEDFCILGGRVQISFSNP